MHVLLIGAGYMAVEYSKVLNALNIDYTVIGRGDFNTKKFEKETGKPAFSGGIENIFDTIVDREPTHAIVASSLESLEDNSIYLLQKGIQHILIEKPGSINTSGLKKICSHSVKNNASTFIAYNRRFYSSVEKAEKLIEQDGGLKSFLFEFTELSHRIVESDKTKFQLSHWFIGNSTHVMDTAFYFGGKPKGLRSYISGSLDWHPKGSTYAGAGITEKDILFSYHANWEAPGSWKLELLTEKNRYIFRPFEKLHVQKQGTFIQEEVKINDELDLLYKPGLYNQVSAFLFNNSVSKKLLSVEEAIEMMDIYMKMNGVAE